MERCLVGSLPFGNRSRRKGRRCVQSTTWETVLLTGQSKRQILVARV